jgi:adenylate cyclase
VRQLERILTSPDFDATRRSRDFLCFVVEETLSGRGEDLTQVAIALEVFGRKDNFDPLLDPIVRIQAGRLRRSLERYYLLAGRQDPVRIELPKGGYLPVFGEADEPKATLANAPSSGLSPTRRVGDAAIAWPAVVVWLFESTSARPGDEETAGHLKEGLTMELGRYREVRVVLRRDEERLEPSRREALRFELRGRLRREAEGFVITARLIDRTTGEQMWGESYCTSPSPGRWHGTLEDIANAIAARVGGEHGVLVQALLREYRSRPMAGGVYGAILRGYNFLSGRDVRELAPTVAALRQVVAQEPENASVWGLLARLYLANHTFELTHLDTPIDQSIAFAYRAVRLDPTSTRMRVILASCLLAKGELRAGREELDQALRQNPGSRAYQELVGWLLALLGDWERGIALMRAAVERNPGHLPQVHHGLWADHLRRGQHEQAYRAAQEYPDSAFFWRSLMRACCLGHLHRTSEAHAEVAELLRHKPDFAERGRILIGRYLQPGDLQEGVVEGLRKAGLALR